MEMSMNQDGQVMKDLLQLLRDTIPLLENVRNSIQDSAGRIPKASDQLSKVSEATETATVEILDLVEEMTDRFTKAEARLQEVKSTIFQLRKDVHDSLSILSSTPYGTLSKERYEELIHTVFAYYNDSMAERAAQGNRDIVHNDEKRLYEYRYCITGAGYYGTAVGRCCGYYKLYSTAIVASITAI